MQMTSRYVRLHLCILKPAVVIIVVFILCAASLEVFILRLVFIIRLHAGQACARQVCHPTPGEVDRVATGT